MEELLLSSLTRWAVPLNHEPEKTLHPLRVLLLLLLFVKYLITAMGKLLNAVSVTTLGANLAVSVKEGRQTPSLDRCTEP